MIVTLAAALAAGFYLVNVPVKVAFFLRAGTGAGFGVGISAFEGRFALCQAERRLQKKHVASKKARRASGKTPADAQKIIQSVKLYAPAARLALRHTRLELLSANARLSFSDAAHTALLTGSLRALLEIVGACFSAPTDARIEPDFSGASTYMEVRGIASIELGYIILAASKALNRRVSKWIDIRLKAS